MSKNFFKPARAVEYDPGLFRNQLKADIEAFVAQGGVIEKLPIGARGSPVIETRRNLNRAQIAVLQARKQGAAVAVDEEEE